MNQRRMKKAVGIFVGLLLLLLAGCDSGGSEGDASLGSLSGAGLFSSEGLGGPRDVGAGSGSPASFTPGGNGTPTPTSTPTPTFGLFVRAGATGIGTEADPRGDLDGALAQAVSGDTVTILYSSTPLVPSSLRSVIPDGVNLVGIADTGSGDLPEVQGRFDVGNNVTISDFESRTSLPTNFDVNGSQNVTFSGMYIVNSTFKVTLDEIGGHIQFLNCRIEGGGPGGGSVGGTITSGSADVTVSNCELVGASLNLVAVGPSTEVDVVYTDNQSGGSVLVEAQNGANSDVTITNNTFTGNRGETIVHRDNCTGNVVYNDNTSPAATGGNFWFRKFGSGGSGVVTLLRNSWQGNNVLPYRFQFQGGNYDLIAVQNQGIESAVSFETFQVTLENTAQLRTRIQNNFFTAGLRFFIGGATTLNAGIFDNDVGQSTLSAAFAPTQYRQLVFFETATPHTGSITAVITGNNIGTAATAGELRIQKGAAATVAIERLGTLATDNNNDVAPIVAAGVTTAPDDSTDIPPAP